MISVCIATYNGEKFIRQQLDSILQQLGPDDEVIVSDDHSTDHTLDIVAAFGDRRIKVLHHRPDEVTTTFPLDKPTHNFEHALKHAGGDYIFLSDQDDVWMPGKCSTMLAALEQADLAVHDCVVTDEDLRPLVGSYFDNVKVGTGVFRNWVKCTYLGCCMAFRRSVLERALPFPRSKVGHDLWIGIVADMYFRTAIVDKPLLWYRKHADSATTSGTKSRYGLWFKIDYRIAILRHIAKLLLQRPRG